ncbi:uncharacterized protein LOC125941406 [Dermacentor silvarum]|uniref:uncharacterized protein LOC125941406 n=1 Tax=Dermacentor silvarum TaxID=543639 RepID=UPI0021007F15|nr:uncharacterized protein LOC125941406 [Dermacentor silvarum]
MRPTAASASLLMAFAVFLASQASENASEGNSAENGTEPQLKFCDNSTTDEERNSTLQCVLGSDGQDVEKLRSYMNHTGTGPLEVAQHLCTHPNGFHHNVTKHHDPNATEPQDLDLQGPFTECEKKN